MPDMIDRLKKVELYAWVGEDELGSGVIGLKQGLVPAGIVALVATSREKVDVDYIRAGGQTIVDQFGKTWFLCKFTFVGALGAIVPSEIPPAHEKTPGISLG